MFLGYEIVGCDMVPFCLLLCKGHSTLKCLKRVSFERSTLILNSQSQHNPENISAFYAAIVASHADVLRHALLSHKGEDSVTSQKNVCLRGYEESGSESPSR